MAGRGERDNSERCLKLDSGGRGHQRIFSIAM